MQKLLGVVMCGGKSERMGTDKGLIKQGDVTWAQLTYHKLKALNLPVVVSVNASQVSAYSVLFNGDDLIVGGMDTAGPLNGVLSVHAQHPDKDMLILACDMIDMDSATLQHLVSAYQTNADHDYYSYHNGEFYEPLCAIYTANALSQLKRSDFNNYTLQKILRNGNTKTLPVTNHKVFTNRNTKIDG